MTKKEIVKAVENAFEGEVKVYSNSEHYIECDVSTRFKKDDWTEKMSRLGFTDNSKHIPNSWKCGEYTIVLFYGACNGFAGKLKLKFN